MIESTLSLVTLNQPGVLVKVATVISGRGLNIHKVQAHVCEQPEFTSIVIGFLGDEDKVRQVGAQLEKLEVVREVTHLSEA